MTCHGPLRSCSCSVGDLSTAGWKLRVWIINILPNKSVALRGDVRGLDGSAACRCGVALLLWGSSPLLHAEDKGILQASFSSWFCSCCAGTRCVPHFFPKIQLEEKGEMSMCMCLLHSPLGAEPVLHQNPSSGGGFGTGAYEIQGCQVSSRGSSAPAGKRLDTGDSAGNPTAAAARDTGQLWSRWRTYLQAAVGQCLWSLTVHVLGATLPFVQHPFFFISRSRAFSGMNMTVMLLLLLFLQGHL